MKKIFLLFLFFLGLFASEPKLQKAEIFDENKFSNSWVMSEKLDGIRAYWDGEKLYTRNGKEIFTPAYFTKNFPPFELDGELWSKRGELEFIQSTVLDKNPSKEWKKITYNIFEVPNQSGNFLKRLEKVENWFKDNHSSYVKIIPQKKFSNKDEIYQFLDKVLASGGEGVMLKNPHLSYEDSLKSNALLKLKKFSDTEGVVIGHNYGKDGRFKSLILELENKKTFNLGGGFSDTQRKKPPKLGEIVKFKYYGWTKYGKPKFASFLGVRKD